MYSKKQGMENCQKRVRKIQVSWTHEMTAKLIEVVESREAVWNFLSPIYRDTNVKHCSFWNLR